MTSVIFESIGRCPEKSLLMKQKNSTHQTPVLALIERDGSLKNMQQAVKIYGKESFTMLYQFIKEYVNADILMKLWDIFSFDIFDNWWYFDGFDNQREIGLLTLIYKGLQSRGFSKNFTLEIVNWAIRIKVNCLDSSEEY
jgi:hypothetical protein